MVAAVVIKHSRKDATIERALCRSNGCRLVEYFRVEREVRLKIGPRVPKCDRAGNEGRQFVVVGAAACWQGWEEMASITGVR